MVHRRAFAVVLAFTFPAFAIPARADALTSKAVLRLGSDESANLLSDDRWRTEGPGVRREGDAFVCDGGAATGKRLGVLQRVELNQPEPRPIVAAAWSKAEGVSGSADDDYSLYLDLTFADGTELWGQTADFRVGTHDWQEAQVAVFPEKPIKSVTVNLLLRRHAGRVSFRGATLRSPTLPAGAVLFDGVPVVPKGPAVEGFQVRDVASGGDYVRIGEEAPGLKLEARPAIRAGVELQDVTIRDTTGKDRAITLLYALPIPPAGASWLDDPRTTRPVAAGREYVHARPTRAGSGRLSTYPFAAVATGDGKGAAIGLDMAFPALYRAGYHAGTGELWIAFDLGLTPEKPEAHVRICRFGFDPSWGFRAALDSYYKAFPDAFTRRVKEQGLWMPFAKISAVPGWEDFGFRIKEGNDETAWDDAHGILTFRYTEPLTWWMPMKKDAPRTIPAAVAEAKRLAEQGRREARAFASSVYHDADGNPPALFRDEPWNHGAVWSMNSMPGLSGEHTDFRTKWNPAIKERLYGEKRKGDLDGEYVDSSEGYVTDELDYRRDHFAAADTPLTFAPGSFKPAIFRGLIAFEYVRAIERDVHAMGRLMMANATPDRLCWLAPLLDVMGTETDWNHGGRWRPMDDADMLYRRALCKGKPFCFLQNTDFAKFPPELVERYMKRSLAYGFFPGFFSQNASEGHYFTRPELYDRDRPLFRKYVPLCRRVAEPGWEPITRARSSDPEVHVERFGGEGGEPAYLTVFNDSRERRTATIRLERTPPASSRDLVRDLPIAWKDGAASLTLDGEDVAVISLDR
ncbi:hypothetical protein OJF2_46030 [Aquisphaera giovannonii]|uniref:Uncharacterized protein n=1 Tax=Aquisphaera giovannonii TaxID=406548 RepID=A0A5B9W7I3_9BACT|nr:hypothetical protein [Aquisphaera giovannonii]QEH36045.1 hypothetical protein OJF2_46030 [Aquisphaera giovannonii]